MTGQQLLLSGRTLGAYMVQDMRRALDYLESRPDVDRARLAVAGNSGGGTQAALLAAVETRLAAVVISCYVTSWGDMWSVPGPQDAEQILPGFVGGDFDFADFALAAAPRGVLVSSAIKDFFPIAGSRAASAELATFFSPSGRRIGWRAWRTTRRTGGRSRYAKGPIGRSAPGWAGLASTRQNCPE